MAIGADVVSPGELERIQAQARSRLFGKRDKPAKIGRFEVLQRLGTGGMGVVYAARDPDLDRTVAIKVLRGSRVSSQAQTRILREAQALARVRHANVVHVYETGQHGDEVYLAMEYVDGVTLTAWLGATTRSLPEIVSVFRAAGRGLVAAHAAGLMHRDFKPDNVIVDGQGQVKVLDFGLARGAVAEAHEASTVEIVGEASSLLQSPITATGALMGTPAYMSPEQAQGTSVTERADQFSFCVSLWEAVYGRRPFASHEGVDLLDALRRGVDPDPPARDRVVSRRVQRVLTRGLGHDPDGRFESMAVLLDALPPDPEASKRKHWRISGAATLGVLALGAMVIASKQTPAADCGDANMYLDGVWDQSTRTSLHEHFDSLGLSFGDTAWQRASQTLDEHADAWVIAYSSTCDALAKSEGNDPALLQQGACLQWRLQQLDSTVQVLGEVDGARLADVANIVSVIGAVSDCEDPARAGRLLRLPDDPQLARQVQSIRMDLARAQARLQGRDYDQAANLARTAVEQSRALGDDAILAESLLALGSAQSRLESPNAESTLREGLEIAALSDHRDAAVAGWMSLLNHLGLNAQRLDEALTLVTGAELAIGQAGNPPQRRIELLNYWGGLLTTQAAFADAEAKFEQSRALIEETSLLGTVVHADLLAKWCGLAIQRGDFERARQLGQESVDVARRVYGPMHPSMVGALSNMASANLQLGHLAEARALYEQMIAVWSSVHDEDRTIAFAIDLLGVVDQREGKLDDALGRHRRALEIRERTLVPHHIELGAAHHNVGHVLFLQGKHEQARPYFERALEIQQEGLGPKHPHVANALAGLAEIDLGKEDFAAARLGYAAALAIFEDAYGPANGATVRAQLALAALDERDGKPAEAVVRYRVALKHMDQSWDDATVGDAEFGAARTLASSGGDPERVQALAASARAHYDRAGSARSDKADELVAWQANR